MHTVYSQIEQKLPNPYMETEYDGKKKKYVEQVVCSKFKTKFADYINHTTTKDTNTNDKNNNTIKVIRTFKDTAEYSRVENCIHFTNTKDEMTRKKGISITKTSKTGGGYSTFKKNKG